MLNEMRSGAGNFAAKVLLALLILSFAVWGIGDIVRHPSRNVNVAKVGKVSIPGSSFASGLHKEKERVQKSLGANYTPELLATLNVPERVLQRMINRSLIQQEAAALGIFPSDADVAARIAASPNFKDDKGRFQKQAFLDMLKRNNMSESVFVEQLRQDMATGLLLQSISNLPPVPEVAVRTLYASLNESRRVTIYNLPASSVVIDEPSADDINTFYKEHASQFSTPEYRTLTYVTITDADIQKRVKVDDDDLRRTYTEMAEEYKRPERRRVEQLLYESEAGAKKAMDMLASGKSMEAVAQATDAMNKKSLSLGDVEQERIIAEAADAVFALKEGGHTEPVKSAFGWHIFHVSKIIPATIAPFEEVREQLRKDAEHAKADETLNQLSNQLLDSLAAGSSLRDTAKELGLKADSLGPVNKEGEDENGNKVKIPELDKFMETAFKIGEKTESNLITSKGGVFYMVRADSVTPERAKPLENVKQAVIDGWKKDQRAQKTAEMAAVVGGKLADPKTRSEAVSEYKLKTSSQTLKRDTAPGEIPESLITDIFSRKLGEATGAHAAKGSDYMIAVVEEIIPAPLASQESSSMSALRESITGSMTDELTEEYMAYLKRRYPVSINETAFKQISGYDNK
jgi:peptidyl-prolyl cis-trans isomerase D